jgi:hypothetical protein
MLIYQVLSCCSFNEQPFLRDKRVNTLKMQRNVKLFDSLKNSLSLWVRKTQEQNMARFFFTPKPKAFNVEPRYWDPKKEERENRERRIKAEMGIKDDDGSYRPHISRGEFKKGMMQGKWSLKTQRRRSNTRLLIIVALLILLLYFMFR